MIIWQERLVLIKLIIAAKVVDFPEPVGPTRRIRPSTPNKLPKTANRGLTPALPPLRLGDPILDALSLREPDLALYDELVPTPMTRDPGMPPLPTDEVLDEAAR